MADLPTPVDKLQHECFTQPVDDSVLVRRYVDLAKFICLLDNEKLYVSRLHLLNDPHEGATPRPTVELRKQFDQSGTLPGTFQLAQHMADITKGIRSRIFVSCWRLGNAESEAMWRLYCTDNHGIAIQTTYRKLVESISDDPELFVGRVTYIDYETQTFPERNLLYPVMHKRLSFAHEDEVRIVKIRIDEFGPETRGPAGVSIEWSAKDCIDTIFIDPYAPDYYEDIVKSVVRQFAPTLEGKVIWTRMRAAPAY